MISGDVGGARAMAPVVNELLYRNLKVTLIEHGWIKQNLNIIKKNSPNLKIISDDQIILEDYIKKNSIGLFFFTPSKKDIFPISLAREAKKKNIPVFYLLDSALRIKKRLNHDNKELFLPKIYALQDQDALNHAITEGIPKNILKVTGQPALGELAKEFDEWSEKSTQELFFKNKINNKKKLIVFISENVEKDHGLNRGYHENIVIPMFCKILEKFSNKIHLGVLPHPSEDRIKLLSQFKKNCKDLSFGQMSEEYTSRQYIMAADGVSGMASILLYESWLIGKNVISLQPGVVGSDYLYLKKKENLKFVSKSDELNIKVTKWLEEIEYNKNSKELVAKNHKELMGHSKAPTVISDLIQDIIKWEI